MRRLQLVAVDHLPAIVRLSEESRAGVAGLTHRADEAAQTGGVPGSGGGGDPRPSTTTSSLRPHQDADGSSTWRNRADRIGVAQPLHNPVNGFVNATSLDVTPLHPTRPNVTTRESEADLAKQ